MNEIMLKQTVTHCVVFCIDDFETDEKWIKFKDRVLNDPEFRDDNFFDNVDRERSIDESDVWVDIDQK
jgi:hypothetical protein